MPMESDSEVLQQPRPLSAPVEDLMEEMRLFHKLIDVCANMTELWKIKFPAKYKNKEKVILGEMLLMALKRRLQNLEANFAKFVEARAEDMRVMRARLESMQKLLHDSDDEKLAWKMKLENLDKAGDKEASGSGERVKNLTMDNKSLESQPDNANDDEIIWKTQFENLSQEASGAAEQVKKLTMDNKSLESLLDNANDDKITWKTRFENLSKEASGTAEQVKKLTMDNKSLESLLDKANDDKITWKTKSENLSMEASGAAEQVQKLTMDLQTRESQLESKFVELSNARSEDNNLEKVCRSVLQEVELRNMIALKRRRPEARPDAPSEDRAHSWVLECIVCTEEFKEGRPRGHWTDCKHVNVCFDCSQDLWKSNKRSCPSCRTPASKAPRKLDILV